MVDRSGESVTAWRRARSVSAPSRGASGWRHGADPRRAAGGPITDLFEAGVRVVRKTRLPTRRGVLGFFGNQVLVNAVAWTAAVAAAGLVKHFFEVRGLRNLWGLTAWSSRTVVSADDYQTITGLLAYSAGLVMLILVRHLVLRLIAELHSLRIERTQGDCRREGAARRPRASIDGPALDLED